GSITGNFHAGQDVLGFAGTANIIGSYNTSIGVLTLSGTDTPAAYQAALRSVTYSNSSEDPSADTRTISFQVDDGAAADHASNIATAMVTVTPVNDAPVITSADQTGSVSEGDDGSSMTATGQVTFSDVDLSD